MPDPESIPRKRIEELRAEHKDSLDWYGESRCGTCWPMDTAWPCDTYKALTLALAADGYREALISYGQHKGGCDKRTSRLRRPCTCGFERLAAGAIGGKPE